jgi:hypothetical protein
LTPTRSSGSKNQPRWRWTSSTCDLTVQRTRLDGQREIQSKDSRSWRL